jgi:hypothetical protein
LAVRSNHCLRFITQDGFVQTDPETLADTLAPEAFATQAAGEGSKGLRLYDWRQFVVAPAAAQLSSQRRRLARRLPGASGA